MNLTDNLPMDKTTLQTDSLKLPPPFKRHNEKQLQIHFNRISNNSELMNMDNEEKKGSGDKIPTQLAGAVSKVKFNPDVTFHKAKPAVFKKIYDMGKF
ncbi:hypothetical protein [Cedecea davisae]|uniref:hypothetical protein n=1 Tax=Cedecea davisae TaxID=158484 RepID=UPI00242D5967|nr:hypothetical protein [Cedecea davisae]